MNRFRPNIVVSGCAPFEEDHWLRLTAGTAAGGSGVDLESVKPCSRCAVTNVEQETGQTGPETLRTLMQFRRGKHLAEKQPVYNEPQWENAAFFSWNLVPHNDGVLRVDDELTVTQMR